MTVEPTKEAIEAAAIVVCNRLITDGDCVMTADPDHSKCYEGNCRVFPVVKDALAAAQSRAPGEGELSRKLRALYRRHIDRRSLSGEIECVNEAADLLDRLVASPAPSDDGWREERERCAKVADDYLDGNRDGNRRAKDIAESIRALKSQPAQDGWFSIKSAPKDGTRFLAYAAETGDVGIISRHNVGGASRNPKHHYECWVTDFNAPSGIGMPTHWRPLPSPPTHNAGETEPKP